MQQEKVENTLKVPRNAVSLEKAGKSASTMFRQTIRQRWLMFARIVIGVVGIGGLFAIYSVVSSDLPVISSSSPPGLLAKRDEYRLVSISQVNPSDIPLGPGSASIPPSNDLDWVYNTVLLVCFSNCNDEQNWYPQSTNSTLYILPKPANVASVDTWQGSIMRPPFGPLIAEFASGASLKRKRDTGDETMVEHPPEWLLPEELNATQTISEGSMAPEDLAPSTTTDVSSTDVSTDASPTTTDSTSSDSIPTPSPTLGFCVQWYAFQDGDSCYAVSNGLVFKLIEMNPDLDCSEIRTGQTICLARLDPKFDYSTDWKCVQSCGSIDNAASVFVQATDDRKIVCAGKGDGSCIWYPGNNCSQLSLPPTPIIARECLPADYLADNWCAEAQRQILQGSDQPACLPTDDVQSLITITPSSPFSFVTSTTQTTTTTTTTSVQLTLDKFTCMQSCKDKGYYVLVIDKGSAISCAGQDVTGCSWYQDAGCKILAPLSAPPNPLQVQGFTCSPLDGGWCQDAQAVLRQQAHPKECAPPVTSTITTTTVAPTPIAPPMVPGDLCIRSCGDAGHFLRVRKVNNRVQCLGKQMGTCSWYTEASCSVLVTLSEHPVGSNGVTCTNVNGGWCAEANRQLILNRPQSTCQGLPPPPPPYSTSTNIQPTETPNLGWKCISSCSDQGHSLFVRNKGANILGCNSQWSWNCTWYTSSNCAGLSQPQALGSIDGVQCSYTDVNQQGTWCNEASNQIVYSQPQSNCGTPSQPPLPTVTPISIDGRCGVEVGTRCDNQCCSQYGICGTSDAHCLLGCRVGWGTCLGNQTVSNVTQPPVIPTTGKRVIGYFPSWGPDILRYDLTGITTINYAFFSMDQNGGLVSLGADYSDNGLIYKLNNVVKKKYPGLTTVVSIGGWTDSRWFSAVAGSAVLRTRFAQNVYNFITRYGFDGVDLDWEFPGGGGNAGNTESPQDASNMVKMIQEIRKLFGTKYLITIAASSDVSRYKDTVPQLNNLLDWINVMTYDFCGPWCGNSGYNAALKSEPGYGGQGNCQDSLNSFVKAGASKQKLSMGLAFYGRSWVVANGNNGGLYQRGVGTPPGDGNDDGGVYTWRGLRNSAGGILRQGFTQPVAPWIRTWRDTAASPTLYHPGNRWFISYDDPQSMTAKTKWAIANGFGGVMVWDLSMDTNREMLTGIVNGLV